MKRRILLAVLALIGVVALAGSAAAGYLWWRLERIPEFSDELLPGRNVFPDATNPAASAPIELASGRKAFLVFSLGSEGLSKGDGDRIGIGAARARMHDGLTDTLLLVVADPDTRKTAIISIPRDTWVEWRSHRINETYKRYGLTALADDVEKITGVRADHAIGVNFAGFADLTDAVGGIRLQLDYAVRDTYSKLDLPAGCSNLDGAQTLSFVRSRHWRVLRGSVWQYDATSSDWGRIERQQAVLRLIAAKIVGPSLPSKVPALLDAADKNLTVDKTLTAAEMLRWAHSFSSGVSGMYAATIPGRGFRTSGGASVIGIELEKTLRTSREVLARLDGPRKPTADTSPTERSDTFAAPGSKVATPGAVSESAGATTSTTSPTATPTVSTPTTPTAAKTTPSSSNRWSPDHGDGNGGLRFKGC